MQTTTILISRNNDYSATDILNRRDQIENWLVRNSDVGVVGAEKIIQTLRTGETGTTIRIFEDALISAPKELHVKRVKNPEVSVVLMFSDGHKVTTSYPWEKRAEAFKQFETYLSEGKNASIVKA